ncbi:MFS transporter [Amycolatopsis sp. CA-230715]|uniref:MFS transporter n=1 Tax=Amycolatopsis sp. CA-230715 TaxID=2745196 RepID=UPI001C01A11B|nr:MFS transporter [Amycolatopsis sp. CA-230715]QWF78644.1 Inner membrane metabolite transport protein YhjE [Amycolatopsis sp. CA-230715]
MRKAEPVDRRAREVRRVVVSSLLGTSMEWYEYFIYGLFAALVFNKLFFPALDPAVGSIASLLTFAVGFVARPIGAVLFGHLGDRVGRKTTLITTIVLIGTATGAIGLLPTYSSIGIAAPVLLAVLRFVQGLSLGGEWSGAVLMAVEHAPVEKRAWYGSMPQLGSPIGTIASSAVASAVTLLPDEQLLAWGWRIPFLLAFPFLAVAVYLRLRVEESPLFQRVQAERREVRVPLVKLLRTSWGRLLAAAAAAMFASGAFFLLTTYAVGFGTKTLGLSADTMLLATLLGALLEGVCIVVSGRLADRGAPWRIMAVGGAVCVVAAFPLTAMIATGDAVLVVLGVAVGIGLLGIPYGPMGTLLSQLFTDDTRYSAVAVSYNIAGLIGGFVPSLALAMSTALDGSAWVIGILFAVICVVITAGSVAAGLLLRKETALTVANAPGA